LVKKEIQTIFDDINFESSFGCGNWQVNYKKLHNDILSGGKQANKQLIVVSVESGLADRLSKWIDYWFIFLCTNR
jgi:hypothetical protein